MNYLGEKFWLFIKWLIKRKYGYCPLDDRDGFPVGFKGRCAGCGASEVQDWIDDHLDLERWIYERAYTITIANFIVLFFFLFLGFIAAREMATPQQPCLLQNGVVAPQGECYGQGLIIFMRPMQSEKETLKTN